MSSTGDREALDREGCLRELHQAGRELSDTIVLFHAAVSEALGLLASDWKTLGLLEQNGPMGAGDLVRLTGMAAASVTGILDRLEKAGWIARECDPVDRRRVLVTLDTNGRSKHLAQAFEPLLKRLSQIYSRLGDAELKLLAITFRDIAAAQRTASSEVIAAINDSELGKGRSTRRKARRR